LLTIASTSIRVQTHGTAGTLQILLKKCWPRKYVKEHQIHTLFRYKLRAGWRLIYTVYGTKSEKVCIILDVFDHKEYEKRFGY